MAELLIYDENARTAMPSPYYEFVHPFDKIIERDKSRETKFRVGKRVAVKELAAIYLFADVKSTYRNYHIDIRFKKIGEDLFGESNWKPDDLILEGVKVYESKYNSSLLQLFKAAESAIFKLKDYYEEIDLRETDENGKLVHSAKSVMDSIANLGKTASSMKELKDMILADVEEKGNIRGGFSTNKFSV